MMLFQRLRSLGSVLLLTVLAPSFSHDHLALAQAPLSPSDDPFYTPPAGYQSEALGTVLKNRTVTAAAFGIIPAEDLTTHQLLYVTSATNGTKIATVTTIFVPSGAATDKFISYHTAEDSSALICSPSYNYQLYANQTDLIVTVEFLVIEAYLSKGYIVAAPDYEGPDSAFSSGHLEGMGVLDGMRAVNNFASTLGLSSSSSPIVGVGYSGGAIATGWAASLQSTYAPELDVKGWVAGGTPANLTGTLLFIDGTTFSGFIPPAVDGLLKPSAYAAELTPVLDEAVTAEGQSYLAYADANCATNDIFEFAGKSILSTEFNTYGPELLYLPAVADVLALNTMGVNVTETPTAPVLLYHAIPDEIIPYANASTLYTDWCANGASVQFTTYASGGHLTTEIVGIAPALTFVADAFAGNLSSGCSATTVDDPSTDPLALLLDVEPILIALLDALLVLGSNDSNIESDISLLSTTVNT